MKYLKLNIEFRDFDKYQDYWISGFCKCWDFWNSLDFQFQDFWKSGLQSIRITELRHFIGFKKFFYSNIFFKKYSFNFFLLTRLKILKNLIILSIILPIILSTILPIMLSIILSYNLEIISCDFNNSRWSIFYYYLLIIV